jgi:hypothetical protein
MEPTFRLSAMGIQPGQDPQAVRTQLQKLLKGDPSALENTFHCISLHERVVLAEGLPQTRARNLRDKFIAIGLDCRLDPMALSLVPLEAEEDQSAFYQCPACGHRQPPAANNALDVCERCGIVGRNYEEVSELKNALDLERRRIQSLMAKDEEKEKREKAALRQEDLRAMALRQIEREMGITTKDKIKTLFAPRVWLPVLGKALLAPRILLPLLGSLTAAAAGVGLLVWQLQTDRSATAKVNPPAALQFAAVPAPDAVFKVEGATPQVVQGSEGRSAPNAAAAATPPAGVAAPGSTPPAGASVKVATSAATSGAPASAGFTAAASVAPEASPEPLLDASKLALASPTAGSPGGPGSNVRPPARDPKLLTSLALYQLQIGDLAAATRSIDRTIELLGTEHGSLSGAQLDAFNRLQVDIRASIASQHYQRREPAIAQTHWYRATNLANSIVISSERAQTFSSLARTLHNVQASTAKDYFNRAIETARLVDDPFSRVQVLSAVARDLARTRRLEQSQDLFAQAMATADAIKNFQGRLTALGVLAKHRAEAGDIAAANTLLGQIAGEVESGGNALPPELVRSRAEAFSALALSRAASGDGVIARADFAAALTETQKLTDPVARADTLLYLARDIAAAGDRDAAARLVALAGTWDE